MAFAHLHLHSEYSLLDGACRIKPLVAKAKALGFSSLAITDHGAMYGVVDFYEACLQEGIHPVIGCEVYVANGSRSERLPETRENHHLVLLCENQTGYQNLIKMVSKGFIEGYYYRPRIDMELLKENHEGIIALSACISGEIPRLILAGQRKEARDVARRFLSIMGEGNYFLEMQDHGMPEQRQVNLELIEISKELGIPLVATNDVHYLEQKDAKVQEVLMCIQTGKTLDDENRMAMSTDQLYLKSEQEMRALFPSFPDAIERTEEIARRCQVEFEFGHYHLPDFPVPGGEDHFSYFQRLCYEGAEKIYGKVEGAVKERLDYEIETIAKCGYVDYYLIVWDFVRFAKENDIPVGPGRGSGTGSICAYSLGITGVDPLEFNLIFERFLNPERVSMPDFDIDFCYERRQEVIDYVVGRYGEDHVSQIITFGTMAARGVIRDVGRVLGMPYAQVDQIAKLIPFQLKMTLEKALELSPELKSMAQNDPKIAQLMEYAMALEGMPRHASTHAAGVVIGARPLIDYIPLQMNDNVITTQFPMTTVERLGLLKMDFLGLRTLTIIKDAMDMAQAEYGAELNFDQLGYADQETYQMLARGDTDGVFQLESAGMRRVVTELEPESIGEVSAVIALYRPGPMESIPRYIRGKKDPSSVTYLSPVTKKALSSTYGCMVYQEQVLQIVREMAGYSMGRSDIVRRAMSKKKKEEMDREKAVFIDGLVEDGEVKVPGAVRLGTPRETALEIFSQMESFAQYAFPQGHAVAYAVVAYQTAYLKCHYPVPFMAACMNSCIMNTDKLAGFIQYCRKVGIEVLPPDVNRSSLRFTVEGGNIRYGLSAVKNVGQNAVNAIIEKRNEGPFQDIFDFCERVGPAGVNKKAVECLIKVGALDCLPGNRNQKMAVYEKALDGAAQSAKNVISGQVSLFGELEDFSMERQPLPPLREYDKRLLLAMEKEMGGVYLSGHPLDEYRPLLEKNPQSIGQFLTFAEDENWQNYDGIGVSIGALVLESKMKTTRSNQMMCFLTVEDLYGSIEALVFPRVYERISQYLQVDSVVQLSGKLSLREDRPPSLIVDQARPLLPNEEIRRLYLKLSQPALMPKVSQVLQQHPGNTQVRVHVDGKTYALPAQNNVSPQEPLLSALRQMLGEDCVKLK